MTQDDEMGDRSSREEYSIDRSEAPTWPLWLVVGLLAIAVTTIGLLMIEYSGPSPRRLAAEISIERQQQQAPAERNGGINLEGTIQIPRDSGGNANE